MGRRALWILTLALVLAGGMVASGVMSGGEVRADCPGKIRCPVTGEWVRRDRCPLPADREKGSSEPACCRKP
jgi:hypothetical protein